MIDDFFSSTLFPKFYLKTESKEIFALGKAPQKMRFQVGLVPFSYDEIKRSQDHFFTPKYYEIRKPQSDFSPHSLIQAPKTFRHDLDKKRFTENILEIQEAIFQKQIQKAILKRETLFNFASQIDIRSFFVNFCKKNPFVFPFIYQEDESTFFFGGTPERLFSRKNLTVKTMALAGTARSNSLEKSPLHQDEKMMKEFQIVLDEISNTLSLFSDKVFSKPIETKIFGQIAHLYAALEAKLKLPKDFQLLEALHPTAAIIGHPKLAALKLINKLEKHKRNYYASCLGYIQDDEADFFVAIRSGIIQENLLRAFAGVGIVEKSDPAKEWLELNLKIKPMKIWGSS